MVIVKLVIFKHNNGASKLRLCDYSQTSFERSPATIMNANGLLMLLLLSPGAPNTISTLHSKGSSMYALSTVGMHEKNR